MRENLSHKNMQFIYGRKMFSGRAKPIRVIGDPDNQLSDKRSSTVCRKMLNHTLM